MNAESPLERRLTELEIKSSYMEDTIEQLNQVIVRQQAQIDLLIREVIDLKRQAPADTGATPRNLRDDLPPHY